MPGPTYTPSAAQADFPNYTGRTVGDSVTYQSYNPYAAIAAFVPFEVQNELLAHQATLVNFALKVTVKQVNKGGGSFMGAAANLYNWEHFR